MVIITFLCIINVSAEFPNSAPDTPIFGSKYDRGIRRISWYIDYNSGAGAYETLLINGVNNWSRPGWPNQIRFVASSNNQGTMMDIYRRYNDFWQEFFNIYGGYPLAETKYYSMTGDEVKPWNVNTYRFTRIYLNHSLLPTISLFNRQGTITHEIGHTLGLSHHYVPCSIMTQLAFGRNVNRVQRWDNNSVVNLYQ